MKPKARRGAQPGNHNAIKHGFYSSAFKQQEKAALTRLEGSDLSGEIDLIRIASLRFLAALQQAPGPLDVQTQLAALRAVNLSAQSIASLIRTQAFARQGYDPEFVRQFMAIMETIHLVNVEQGVIPPDE